MKTILQRIFLVAAIIINIMLFFNAGISAQESIISPDRPGFSPGTSTVDKGRINAEFGYLYSFKSQTVELSSHTLPNLALRAGAGKNIEYYGSIPIDTSRMQNTVNAGLTWLVTNNLAIDIVGGIGLNEHSVHFSGAGMSYRF
jgi:hypothetical protein